jgi:hypothetical protein
MSGEPEQKPARPVKTGPSWWNPLAKGTPAHWLINSEGSAVTLAFFLAVWLWLIPWRPSDVYWTGFCAFAAGFFAVWHSNAQSSSVVDATDRSKLADDKAPVRGMVISLLPIAVSLIGLVLHLVGTLVIQPNGQNADWMVLEPSDWALIALWDFACIGDVRHNSTMFGRTQRYRQEYGSEQQTRD